MKRLLPVLFVSLIAFSSLARQPHRGYRGFFDVEFNAGKVWYNDDAAGEDKHGGLAFLGVSTTHGYQINNHIFTGIGFLVAATMGTGTVPLYADVRYDNQWGKFTPYGDFRIGYDLINQGLYLSPTVGYRFNWGRKVNLNLGAGMTLKPSQITEPILGTIRSVTGVKYDPVFTLRLGIDF